MNPDTFANLQMPYLQAIQRIPGDTASEKLKKIGKLVSNKSVDSKDRELFHFSELQLLLQVEIAVKDRQHENIISALRSNDSTIVSRAFKATWFFEDENNFEIFWESIFPFVSVRTRARIVKTMRRRIKNSIFAQRMFIRLEAAYDIETALPLLVCCEEKFIGHVILKRKLMLPNGILKKIFRKNALFAAHLLWIYIQKYDTYLMNNKEFVKKKLPEIHAIQVIRKYLFFLPMLAKHNPQAFGTVIKRVPICTEIIVLSNKCAKKFLKEAIDIVAQNPEKFLPIMSLKVVKAKQMEILLPNLIKHECKNFFNTNKMLDYLRYFPAKKTLELLFNAYKNFYHRDLLRDIENVTFKLLQLLPTHQRIETAKKLIERYPNFTTKSYQVTWICYLPVKKSIPVIKRCLKKSSFNEEIVQHILRMLYTCTVNKDNIELSTILRYILRKGYIEKMDTRTAEELIDNILDICNLSYLTLENGTLVFNIIKKFFEKHGYVRPDFLEDLLYFKLSNKLEFTDLMSILFTTNDTSLLVPFNMFTNNLRYERRCLLAFIDFIEKNYIHWYEGESQEGRQTNVGEGQNLILENKYMKKIKKVTLCRFVLAMYNFNKKCQNLDVKRNKHIKRITIKDYPKLLNAIHAIMCSPIDFQSRRKVRKVLRIYERELYCSWFQTDTSEDIAAVASGAALRLLKTNPQSVLNNWEKYLINCKKYYREKEVQRFLRAIRWYKDIPLNFAKHCIDNLYGKNRKIQEMLPDLVILGILLGSNTFKKLLELSKSFLLEQIKLCNNRIDIISTEDPTLTLILSIFGLYNVSVPMEIIATLFTESKSFVGKMTLLRVLVRVSSDDMLVFETKLPMMCMLMRKYWIDIMCSIKYAYYRINFLSAMWRTEKHWTVRENILEKCLILFRDISKLNKIFDIAIQQPLVFLLKEISMSFTLDDIYLLKTFEKYSLDMDKKYMWNYYQLWLIAIKCLSEAGLHSKFTRMHTLTLLKKLDSLNSEPEFLRCIDNLLCIYLFHENTDISSVMRYYALLYFSESFHKNENREIYLKIIFNVLHYIQYSREFDFKNLFIYSTKNAMHAFLTEFVVRFVKLQERIDYINVIDCLLNLFSLKLSRVQNAKVYLLLRYAKILYNCKKIYPFREDNFGRELGRHLPDLIETFSEYLIPVIIEILELFVKIIYGSDNYSYNMTLILDSLMMVDNTYITFITMTILSSIHKSQYYSLYILPYPISHLWNTTINL